MTSADGAAKAADDGAVASVGPDTVASAGPDVVASAGQGLEAGEFGLVHSEFARVAVGIDATANGPRLRLRDLRTGHVRYLDALELETIVWLPAERMDVLLDPSAGRWRDA